MLPIVITLKIKAAVCLPETGEGGEFGVTIKLSDAGSMQALKTV